MLKITICLWLAAFAFFLDLAERAPTFPSQTAMAEAEDDDQGDEAV